MKHPFHEFPKHLYHGTLEAVIAHNKAEEAEARAKGYGDDYIPKKYPMAVGRFTVTSRAEEKAARETIAAEEAAAKEKKAGE